MLRTATMLLFVLSHQASFLSTTSFLTATVPTCSQLRLWPELKHDPEIPYKEKMIAKTV